jgi:probable rRNA maturation factor
VLSFGYRAPDNLPEDVPAPPFNVLGDIVISLETVEKLCEGERGAMRDEIRLLFCHGLLHLLGYVHDTKAQQTEMRSKQALYLGISEGAAWRSKPL